MTEQEAWARTVAESGLNKYGCYSEDPFDAKKARELTDKKNWTTHFAPISWALAAIKSQAEQGKSVALLIDKPWRDTDAYGDEMRMHLRDRGFKVTHVSATDKDYAHTRVEW